MSEGRGEGRSEGRGEGRSESRGEGRSEGRGEGRSEGRGEGRSETIEAYQIINFINRNILRNKVQMKWNP